MKRLVFLLLLACSSSTSGTDGGNDATTDTTAKDATSDRDPNKNCVKPGTPNNELGVGGYCDPGDGKQDCVTNLPDGGKIITFCSAIQAPPDEWFCTKACMMGDSCGTAAHCACQGGQCGCVPDVCDPNGVKDATGN